MLYKKYVCLLKKLIFRRYWLFGEKEQKGDTKLKRIRGWLPQPCAIEVIENTYDMDKMFKDD